jgi:D-serine deaminase-like pyridoxal phosphate-dependent protein
VTGNPYFAQLSQALRAAGIHQPCLVLDLDRLNGNIASIKSRLAPGLQIRIVDKSLPCLPLLDHIRTALQSDLVMTFHVPVAAAVAQAFPAADLLFGKPMPVGAARQALTKGALVDPGGAEARIVWLIDTDERLAAYGAGRRFGDRFALLFRGGCRPAPRRLPQSRCVAARTQGARKIPQAALPGDHGL